MTEPTPIHRKRVDGRSRKVKLSAVLAADMVGVVAASRQTGIPASSIEVWMKKPEYAEIRTRTREDLVEEVKVVAHLAWRRVADTMATMEPRDAIFAADKAATILQLLSGEATARTEHRDITADLPDHERETLSAAIDEWLADHALPEPG